MNRPRTVLLIAVCVVTGCTSATTTTPTTPSTTIPVSASTATPTPPASAGASAPITTPAATTTTPTTTLAAAVTVPDPATATAVGLDPAAGVADDVTFDGRWVWALQAPTTTLTRIDPSGATSPVQFRFDTAGATPLAVFVGAGAVWTLNTTDPGTISFSRVDPATGHTTLTATDTIRNAGVLGTAGPGDTFWVLTRTIGGLASHLYRLELTTGTLTTIPVPADDTAANGLVAGPTTIYLISNTDIAELSVPDGTVTAHHPLEPALNGDTHDGVELGGILWLTTFSVGASTSPLTRIDLHTNTTSTLSPVQHPFITDLHTDGISLWAANVWTFARIDPVTLTAVELPMPATAPIHRFTLAGTTAWATTENGTATAQIMRIAPLNGTFPTGPPPSTTTTTSPLQAAAAVYRVLADTANTAAQQLMNRYAQGPDSYLITNAEFPDYCRAHLPIDEAMLNGLRSTTWPAVARTAVTQMIDAEQHVIDQYQVCINGNHDGLDAAETAVVRAAVDVRNALHI